MQNNLNDYRTAKDSFFRQLPKDRWFPAEKYINFVVQAYRIDPKMVECWLEEMVQQGKFVRQKTNDARLQNIFRVIEC